MNINFELYRIFYVVATIGNITKASQKLMISQPAVTKQIKVLEQQLGGELFIRTKRGVFLTDNGKEIYNYIKQGMECFEQAQLQFSNLKKLETGVVRIGVSTTLARLYLLKYLDKFHHLHPNIAIQLFTDPSITLRKKIKDGSLDILIAKEDTNEDKDLDVVRIGLLHHCFIAGKTFSNLKDKCISLEDLNNYPILLPKPPSTSRDSFNNFCIENNITINSKLEIASSTLLEDLVSIGLGIGFVTKEYAQSKIDSGEIFELKTQVKLPEKGFSIITLKNSLHSFGANELKKMMEEDLNI